MGKEQGMKVKIGKIEEREEWMERVIKKMEEKGERK